MGICFYFFNYLRLLNLFYLEKFLVNDNLILEFPFLFLLARKGRVGVWCLPVIAASRKAEAEGLKV